jgi:hypothetical protein
MMRERERERERERRYVYKVGCMHMIYRLGEYKIS